MGIPLHVDAFLPLAEAPQSVVCVVRDLQVLLRAESTDTEALPQSSEGSGQILLHRKAGDRGRWVPACSEKFPWKRNQISFGEDRDFQQAGRLPSETASTARGSRKGQKRVPVPAGLAQHWAPGHHIVYGARPCARRPSSLQAQAPRLSPQSSWVSTDLQTSSK